MTGDGRLTEDRSAAPDDRDACGGRYLQHADECPTIERLCMRQLDGLRASLRRAVAHAPFYRRHLGSAAVEPQAIDCHGDAQDLPLTTWDDLGAADPWELLAVRREEVVRIDACVAGDAPQVPVFWTKADVELCSELAARALAAGGLRAGEVLQVPVADDEPTCAAGLAVGAGRLGVTVLRVAGDRGRQIEHMRAYSAAALECRTRHAESAIEGSCDRATTAPGLPTRLAFIDAGAAGQRVAGGLAALGMTSLQVFGLPSLGVPWVAFECFARSGLHVHEDHFLAEIIDPQSGISMPESGVGEIVLTTLSHRARPLFRFRTGRFGRLDYGPCACGRTFARLVLSPAGAEAADGAERPTVTGSHSTEGCRWTG